MKVNPVRTGQQPAPSADSPDAVIVIFGAGVRPDGQPSATLRHRVEAAIRFGATRLRPLYIPTGGQGRYGDPEAVVMARLLRQSGVPDTAIVAEATATDTLSSVRAVLPLLQAYAPAPVFACSSAYHLPRCVTLLRLAGAGARACPPPPVPASGDFAKRWYWRLREVPALPYDAALVLWHRMRG